MRVLVATLLPDGGPTATALRRLGYETMTARVMLSKRNLRTPWKKFLNMSRQMSVSSAAVFPPGDVKCPELEVLAAATDAAAGAPAAFLMESVLSVSPLYTKVILVEEPCKEELCSAMNSLRENLERDLPRLIRADVLSLIPGGAGCPMPPLTPDLMEKYMQHVISLVPPERLLIFRPHAGDSWKELCDFLQIEQSVPDSEPFPKIVGEFDGGCFEFRMGMRGATWRARLVYLVFALILMFLLQRAVGTKTKRNDVESE